MISLSVSAGSLPPELQDLYNHTSAKTLVRLAGKTVEKALRAHFLAHKPNKKGWPSRGLWGDIAERTAMGAVGGGQTYASVEVSISHPAMNLKVHGGTVTPKRGRYLAIPATAQAYAAGSPREGAAPSNMKVVTAYNSDAGHWMKALAQDDSDSDDLSRHGTIWYWLARKTKHAPDPEALPKETDLQTAIDETIRAHLERARQRQAA